MEVRCRRLEGKVAIVTASTQGIGLAIAERLGLEGAAASSFCGSAWESHENVDEAVEGLRGKGIAAVGANFGHIDVLVSNAAANPTVDGIPQMKEAVLDKLWNINVKASILLLQEAAPHLRKGSSVIIISSIGERYNVHLFLLSFLILFALFRRCQNHLIALAVEMGPNTRVNCIAPGFVPTRFTNFLTTNETIRKELTDRTPLKRLGSVEDMAAAAAFLASEDASFITAETIVAAGGMQSRL
ncbi:hypothetical protein PAHAL_2G017900 [Panicum hallii]|uniref:Uncharacterized protein n=1 Tax=Panicum hallii TaxID=206008 RepID=A0A2T8KMH6_9POAL|nr:hypothetical protein PAHAL_2G017900 [Panicum hallii]